MKTKILIFSICAFFLSCNSQNIKSKDNDKNEMKPHESVKVNKKYDEAGNLIEFDSVYTSYYSNFIGDTINTDSVMGQFSQYFNSNFNHAYSNNFFSDDSIISPGFFHYNYFENQFLNQDKEMLDMMRRMDSIKNTFFQMHSQGRIRK